MSQRAVFVIGCPRSGTSLVGGLIGRHPMVFNAEESLFLYLMSNWSAMLKPPVAPLTERFITAASALMKETMLTATTEAGRSIYLDHSPWHALCLDEVYQLFPTASVVHVVRHPADVAGSLARSYRAGYRWAGATPWERVETWCRFVEAADRYKAHPGFVEVRYEDLCRAPVQHARELLQRLELPWVENVLGAFSTLHARSTSSRAPLGQMSDSGLVFRRPDPVGCTRSHAVLRAIEELARPLLTAHGHEWPAPTSAARRRRPWRGGGAPRG